MKMKIMLGLVCGAGKEPATGVTGVEPRQGLADAAGRRLGVGAGGCRLLAARVQVKGQG